MCDRANGHWPQCQWELLLQNLPAYGCGYPKPEIRDGQIVWDMGKGVLLELSKEDAQGACRVILELAETLPDPEPP
jgi:hypothetical protein